MDKNKFNPICEFYRNQELFITGATGIVGKSLVEVLLRSYPDISKIYILLRDKKGNSYDARLEEFKKTSIFDIIRENNPKVLNKIVAIKGDIAEKQLGISSNDLERLKNVSIVFHAAAAARFDETLKSAIFQNLKGTLEAMKISEKLKNLKKFVHVSTAYCYPYKNLIKEELYPPLANWKHIIEIVEKCDPFILDLLTPKLIAQFPDTYTFSKHLAEHAVNEYKNRLPVVIARPSIVTSTITHSSPEFFDTLTNTLGKSTFCYTGLGRAAYCELHNFVDTIPLESCSMFLSVVAWKDFSLPPLRSNEDVRVFNLTGDRYQINPKNYVADISRDDFNDVTFLKTIYFSKITYIDSKLFFMINFYILNVLPALFWDSIVRLTSNETLPLDTQRKFMKSLNVMNFFMNRNCKFQNDRLQDIIEDVKKYVKFPMIRMFSEPKSKLLDIGIPGMQRILSKKPNLPITFKLLKYLDMAIHYFLYYWIGKKLYFCFTEYWPFN